MEKCVLFIKRKKKAQRRSFNETTFNKLLFMFTILFVLKKPPERKAIKHKKKSLNDVNDHALRNFFLEKN